MTRLWAYSWKSSDGVRHEDTIEAPTREAAFESLRGRGVKPIKVTQRVRPVDRILSWLSRGAVLVAVAVVAAVAAFTFARKGGTVPNAADVAGSPSGGVVRLAMPLPRRQIDLSGIDLGSVFAYRGEAYLCRYAAPGVVRDGTAPEPPDDLAASLGKPIAIEPGDSPAVVELKRVVAGIKEDVSLFLANGKSLASVAEWLELRQQMEANFRRQLIGGRGRDARSKADINSKLRAMGLEEIE